MNMGIFGTHAAQSVAGTQGQSHIQARHNRIKEDRDSRISKREDDRVEVEAIEAPDRVQPLADATHEDAREDRRSKARPRKPEQKETEPAAGDDDQRPTLDVKA
ncbi:MAG: hypothetical protein JJU33_14430 [Phycisphaerales bacterium]|nr:hypothetical protein [Phycisphaerales bacterium]